MNIPKINLHIHSKYSDGLNSIREIVTYALNNNFSYISITDHFTNSYKSKIIPSLDSKTKIDAYLKELIYWKNYCIQNQLPLRILTGIEIDLESSLDYIQKLISADKFDIILFEYFESINSTKYIEDIFSIWKKNDIVFSNTIFGFAHLDPSLFSEVEVGKLVDFMNKYDIFFEFNSRYSEYYSNRYEKTFFKKIKEKNIQVSISSDAHNLSQLDKIIEPFEKVLYFDLQQNFAQLIRKLR